MSTQTELRVAGRMKSQRLRCELGEVIDMSGGGMRVATTQFGRLRPGDEMQLQLQSRLGVVHVRARICWVRRQGLRKRQVGMAFVNLDEGARAALWSLARGVGPKADQRFSRKDTIAVREANWREMIHALNATG